MLTPIVITEPRASRSHMSGTSLASRLTRLMILGNLAGALLAFAYFNFLDPSAHEGAPAVGPAVWTFFIVSFAFLAVVGRALSRRWSRPVIGAVPGALP